MLFSFAECVGPSFSENTESHCALFNFQSNGKQGPDWQSDFFIIKNLGSDTEEENGKIERNLFYCLSVDVFFFLV